MPGPGRSFRKTISLVELFEIFPDDKTAEDWFVKMRWPDGVTCPYCGSDKVQHNAPHPTMPFRCQAKGCRKRFSVKIGTLMHASNIDYRKWAIAIYLTLTNLKGVSSMKLHNDLNITQKSAWHMLHRIREAYDLGGSVFEGPTEGDEVFMGGRVKNMHRSKRPKTGRGTAGKTAVVGLKDRATGQIKTKVVPDTTAKTLQGYVVENTAENSTVYTDDASAYLGLKGRTHETVKHSAGEYVRDMAHTNGIESFWATVRRGYHGTYHHFSTKHMQKYFNEFSGRHNIRNMDTIDQMGVIVTKMEGKRLKYEDLIDG